MNLPSGTRALLLMACLLMMSACAFNVRIMHKSPAQLVPEPPSEQVWTLTTGTPAILPVGRATTLKGGTLWRRIGRIEEGDVMRTKDQVVFVEASNSYQADIVVRDGKLVGFYLPVDLAFAPCSPPMPIALTERAN